MLVAACHTPLLIRLLPCCSSLTDRPHNVNCGPHLPSRSPSNPPAPFLLPSTLPVCAAPGRFISYDPQIPKELLDNGGPRTGKMDINNTLGHFELVNYQIKQVGRGPGG